MVQEYQGLERLMKADDCVQVQVGEEDWAVDRDLAEAGAWGEALQLTHSPAGSVMSDVVEPPTWVVSAQRGDRIDARLHSVGDGSRVRRTVGVLSARVLFAGAAGVGLDDLDVVLRDRGKLPSKWADSLDNVIGDGDSMDVSDDHNDLVGVQLAQPGQCNGTCG